jgi:nitrogen PTS system EIIA component
LAEVIVPSALIVGLEMPEAGEAIRALVDRLCAAEPSIPRDAALRAVVERERRFASTVGRGVAVPHARHPELKRAYVALGRFVKPVRFASSPDGVPVRLVFLVLSPSAAPVAQLRILARVAALASDEAVRRRMLRAKSPDALLETLKTADTLLAD